MKPDKRDFQLGLEAFVADSRTPGGVLAWSVEGSPVEAVVAGTTGGVPAEPMTSDAAFNIASLTKIFTGVMALRVFEQLELTLDSTVANFLPDWPNGSVITLRHLLSHMSGLSPQGDDAGTGDGLYAEAQSQLLRANLRRQFSLAEDLDWLKGRPLLALPGTVTHYSNANFLLVARIAEVLTGATYVDLVHRCVLDPLELRHTWYAPDEPAPGPVVSGVFERDGETVSLTEFPMTAILSHVGPAGALVSNAIDLCMFGVRVLRNHELLTEQAAAEAFKIGSGGSGLGVLGVSLGGPGTSPFNLFSHDPVPPADFVGVGGSGLLPGVSTKLVYLTTTDTVFALLLNRSSPPGDGGYFRRVLTQFAEAETKV